MSYVEGWINDPEAVGEVAMMQPMPIFGMTPAGGVAESQLPDEVFLWKNYENKTGKKWPSLSQGSIGSCVGFGTACAIEATLAAQINSVPNLVQEQIYGGSRVEIGKGRIKNGDGSVGAWAAECARQYGVIKRGIHGKYDLTDYSVKLCKEWGNTGIPDDLEPECRKHLVGAITLVRDWASARKALASRIAATPGLGALVKMAGSTPYFAHSSSRASRVLCTARSWATRSGVRAGFGGVAGAFLGVSGTLATRGWALGTGTGLGATGSLPVALPPTIVTPDSVVYLVPLARAYSPFAHHGT